MTDKTNIALTRNGTDPVNSHNENEKSNTRYAPAIAYAYNCVLNNN